MKEYSTFNISGTLYEHLKKLEPLQVAYHSDADGVASVGLLASVFEIQRNSDFPYSPLIFGCYKEGNVSVDLGAPLVKAWSGTCIDHHSHPENPAYPLVLGNIPTGLIIYEALKDKIPVEKTWLCVLSAVGDGQPECISDEVWDQHPELWNMLGNIYKTKYGSLKSYSYPLYAKVSSPINALCRVGAVSKALDIVLRASSIRDIIENPTAQLAQKEISAEENRVLSDQNNPVSIEVIDHFGIVTYKSKYNLGGRILANLQKGDQFTTFIIVNTVTKDVSIRGTMAKYITNKISAAGYLAGGHAGFCAVSLLPSQTPEMLINDIRRIVTRR